MATKRGYARRQLGGGNLVKAVTRARRRASGHSAGRAPGKAPGPAVWRVHERRALEALQQVADDVSEREEAA